LKNLFVATQGAQLTAPVKIYKWSLAPYGCELIATATPGRFYNLLLSPNQKYLVLSTGDGITAWDAATGKQLCSIAGAAAAFHPKGSLAVADMQNSALVYWDLAACLPGKQLAWAHYSDQQAMEFTPNGKYLLTYRQGIQVWDSQSGALLLERLPAGAVTSGRLEISPNGRYLLSIANPNAPNALVELWEIGNK
jgi:WD40 repeat protein